MLAPREEVMHTDKYTGNRYLFRRSALPEQNRRAPIYAKGKSNPYLVMKEGGPVNALRQKNVGNNDSARSFARIASEPNAHDMATVIQTKVMDDANLRIMEGQLTTQRASGQRTRGQQTQVGGPTGASGYGQTTMRVIPYMEWVNGVLVFAGHHNAPDVRPDGNQLLVRGDYEPSRQNRGVEHTFHPTPAGPHGDVPVLPPVVGNITLTEGLQVPNMGSAAELHLDEPVPKLFTSTGPKHKMKIDGVEIPAAPMVPGSSGLHSEALRDDSSGLPMLQAPILPGREEVPAGIGAVELAEDSWANSLPQPDQVAAMIPGETPMVTLNDGELMHIENPANRPEIMKVAGPGQVQDPLRGDARMAELGDPMYDVVQPERFDSHHEPTGHDPMNPFPTGPSQAVRTVRAGGGEHARPSTNRGTQYQGPSWLGAGPPGGGSRPVSMGQRNHMKTGSDPVANTRQRATNAVRASPARIELHRGSNDGQLNRRLGARSGANVNPLARRQAMDFSGRDSTKLGIR